MKTWDITFNSLPEKHALAWTEFAGILIDIAQSHVRKPQFYEVYSSSSSFETLKIPNDFVGKMEGRTCGIVSLTGPSGNTWQVRLVEQGSYPFFHHGWSTFTKDHHLEYGDLLVFRYEGDLHFTVQVFGKNACEKEAAFHSECSQNSFNLDNIEGLKRDAEEISSLDVVGGVQKKMRRDTVENQELELAIVGRELPRCELAKPIRMIRETEETYGECSASACSFSFKQY